MITSDNYPLLDIKWTTPNYTQILTTGNKYLIYSV